MFPNDDDNDNNLDIGFDVGSVQPEKFDLIPDGVYAFEVVKVRVDPTRDGTGKRLNLELALTTDGVAGRRVFDGLNIRNQNPKAEAIARQQCAALFKSCGIGGTDASALVGRSGKLKLGTQPEKDGYEARNIVKRYLFGAQATPAAVAPTPAADPAQPPKRKPPAFVK